MAPTNRMHFEAVPVLALSDAEIAAARVISDDEVYRLLPRKVRRGRAFAFILSALGAIGAAWAFPIAHSVPWGITAIVLSIVFATAGALGSNKLALAERIVAEPRTVFWIHPTELRQTTIFGTKTTNFITLHTTTSGSFEVAIPRADMVAIAAWVKRHNPDVRLGAYEA